jgi:murein DD-endopeptidase MepM/ murein hydrolase activator NlpD
VLTRFKDTDNRFFVALEATEQDLLRYFGGGRVVRTHRRLPIVSLGQLTIAALILVIIAGLVMGDIRRPGASRGAAVASPALVPPLDIDLPPVAVPERPAIVELRGGDRASRYQPRATRSTASLGSIRDVQRRPTPSRWVSPLRSTKITSCYGPRWGRMHEGVDFNGEIGDVIHAVGPGVIRQVGWRYGGLGNTVIVDHGRYLTVYAHASRTTVRVGQHVIAGDVIARVGTTGNVTGSHLHLIVSNGNVLANLWNTVINPTPWLRGHGVPVGRCR